MNVAQPLLSLTNLSYTRDSMAVLKDGHLVINPGELVCLRGPNGSGKTSLAEVLAGFPSFQITAGSVQFKGNDLLQLSIAERVRDGLYIAFQQVPEFDSVITEVMLYEAYAARYGVRSSLQDFNTLITSLVHQVGLQTTHLNRPLFQSFSGGERKRVQLLELLLLKPSLIILDELDAGLDVEGLSLFFNVIEQLKAEDPTRAFLVISHNDLVLKKLVPNRCYLLANKKLTECVL